MKVKVLAMTLSVLVIFFALTGCNPYAQLGEKTLTENRKNVEYLAEKLTKYYKADSNLTDDDRKDRAVPVDSAVSLAKKMEAQFKQ